MPAPAPLASPFDAPKEFVGAAPPRTSPFDVSSTVLANADGGSLGAGGCGASGPSSPQVMQPKELIHTERAQYFIITSNNMENVVKSVRHGLWATQRKNESKLDDAYFKASAVILIFSVNRSDVFQGYALMRSPIGRPKSVSRDPFNGFGRLFNVEWLRLHDLPYQEVDSLRNPLQDGRQQVTASRDGQELANEVGRQLCGLIDRHVDNPDSFTAPKPTLAIPAPPPNPMIEIALGRGPSDGAAGHAISPSADDIETPTQETRRKKRRLMRNPPHPLEKSFDEQLDFFLAMDYEDYVHWFQQWGAVSPGPNLPPEVSAAVADEAAKARAAQQHVDPYGAFHHAHHGMPPHMAPPMQGHHPHHGNAPGLFRSPPHMLGPPLGMVAQPHMMHPHMVAMLR